MLFGNLYQKQKHEMFSFQKKHMFFMVKNAKQKILLKILNVSLRNSSSKSSFLLDGGGVSPAPLVMGLVSYQ